MTNGLTKPPEPKWLMYLISFLVPLVGIILGIIYLTKPEEENKHFGKRCLMWAIIAIALFIVLWIIYAVVFFSWFATNAPVTY
ncbi:MAG: hypothetical protein DRH49_01755 [Candidatus Coatesbacteria bacterium]|nr:MAG: hypothetical protein DRH49_01755 [Candidatus Coatesbacteria bacterium]